MKPSQVAAALRDIATKIDRSKSPDRRLVASAVKRVLAAMSGPNKPSDLDQRTQRGTPPRQYFTFAKWYMAYKDPQSQEFPIIIFINDGDNADVADPGSSLLIMSFGSEAEYQEWKGGEVADPKNVEPIDPNDADDLAAQAQFLETSHF